MIKLYQFPISHFCEKIRWALDFKQLPYQTCNLLPGPHMSRVKKLARRSSVPVLEHKDQVIQGSDNIITYLDETFPDRSLTPDDPNLRDQALDWERFLDAEIGVNVRLCCYHILLDHPNVVIPFFIHNGPWYGKIIMPLMFKKLAKAMRGLMNINPESAELSSQKLAEAIDRLHGQYQQSEYLVGGQFSRADLAAAALLAPLTRPREYGLEWPDEIPVRLRELSDRHADSLGWVHRMYQEYR